MSTVKIKRSGTASSTPSSLDHGELAINYADDTLFWKDDANVIKSFVFQAYASATHASTHATGGSDALTPSDIGAAPAASPTFTGTVTVPGLTSTDTVRASPTGVFSAGYNTWTGDGVYLSSLGATPANGALGSAISWSRTGSATTRAAAIAAVQTGADNDLIGLSFWVHSSTSATDDIVEAARITHSGWLGIGRTSPATALDVNGVITVSATSGSAGSYAPSLTISGDPNTGFGQVSGQSDTASIFTAGSERVRVKSTGAVRFVPLSADPASGETGDVYYNSTTNKLRVYNGTSWVDLH